MPACPPDSRILVTGAAGFLGRHLVAMLEEQQFRVRGLDVAGAEGFGDFVAGSVTDAKLLETALEGVSGLVIAHMLPNTPENYADPRLPIEVNVSGAALLMQMAAERGIKRVVLISSVAVVDQARVDGRYLDRDLAPCPRNLYGLTKTMQETAARFHHARHGLEIAILRPAYVISGDNLTDKYGVQRPSVNWQAIDPRDIGQAAAAALRLEDLGLETFYLMAGPEVRKHADVAYTETRLGWQPRYRFEEFPRDP